MVLVEMVNSEVKDGPRGLTQKTVHMVIGMDVNPMVKTAFQIVLNLDETGWAETKQVTTVYSPYKDADGCPKHREVYTAAVEAANNEWYDQQYGVEIPF